jgi:hypothetical protein
MLEPTIFGSGDTGDGHETIHPGVTPGLPDGLFSNQKSQFG